MWSQQYVILHIVSYAVRMGLVFMQDVLCSGRCLLSSFFSCFLRYVMTSHYSFWRVCKLPGLGRGLYL